MKSLKEQIKKRIRTLRNVIMLPLTWLAGKWLWWLRNQRIENFPYTRILFSNMGVFPIIDHYYDPLFQEKYLHKSSAEQRQFIYRLEHRISIKLVERVRLQS